jgi:hypothetical protein
MSESLARTSAGIRLYVNATPPVTQNAANFKALSWDEVGEIENVGEFGKQYNLVTFNPLGDRKTFKRKGSYNNGQLALQMAKAPGDTGQAICIAALDEDSPVAFKVRFEEAKDDLGRLLYFVEYDNMTVSFNVGATLEGETSEATALIVGVDDNGDGTGTLAVVNVDGTFLAAEAITDDDDIAPGAAEFVSTTKGDDEAAYFVGMVLSYTTNVGSVDQILGSSCNIEIDGDIYEVAASTVD